MKGIITNLTIRIVSLILSLGLVLHVPTLYAAGNRGAAVPEDLLPKELEGLEIKDYYVSSFSKKAGVLHAINGTAIVIHQGAEKAYFGQAGDKIYVNDRIYSLTDSQCRIKFYNEDVVSLAENTDFRVDSYKYEKKEGMKESAFSLKKGKAMVYAMRLLSHKSSKLRIKTPTAVADIRGTKFAVGVFWEKEEKRADSGMTVATSRNDFSIYLAQAGGGQPQSHTDFHSFDGNLQVTAQINGQTVKGNISPGNSFNGKTGFVGPTPGNVANEYNQATNVISQKTGKGAKEAIKAEINVIATAGTGGGEFLEDLVNLTENLDEATVRERVLRLAELISQQEPGPLSGILKGYFTALLTDASFPVLEDVYVPTGIQTTTSDTAVAKGVLFAIQTLTYDDTTGRFREFFINLTSAVDVPVTGGWELVKIVDNAYQWGYWGGSDVQFNDAILGGPWSINNKVWLLEGYPTSDSIMNQKTGSYAYSFNVDGTSYSTTGGSDLSGSGSCNVNFTANTVGNFGFEALSTDNQNGAKVLNGQGTVTGSEFAINAATYQLKSGGGAYQAALNGRVVGAFYGDNAYMGFAWGMVGTTSAAAGIGHDARN